MYLDAYLFFHCVVFFSFFVKQDIWETKQWMMKKERELKKSVWKVCEKSMKSESVSMWRRNTIMSWIQSQVKEFRKDKRSDGGWLLNKTKGSSSWKTEKKAVE